MNKPLVTKMSFTLLAVFSLIGLGNNNAMAADLPGGHDRWIGDIEGEVVDAQDSAVVYEFRFSEGGTVLVLKHMTVRKLIQTFDWEMSGADVRITGNASGPIGELAGQTLQGVDDKRFTFKWVDGKTDIEIKRSKQLISWLHIAGLFLLLFIGNEVARRYKVAPYILFIILPIVLTPIWLDSGLGWFRIAKVYSALAIAVFITLYRFNFDLNKKPWALTVIAAMLAINIFEAVTQDLSQPDLANKWNAFAGFLNITTIYLWSTIKTDENKPHDMLWPGMTIGWIIAYDIWNVAFVYINFPNTVSYTLWAVLLAPTLAAIFIKKGTWLQARAYTLSLYMMYIVTREVFDFDITLTEPLARSEGLVWVMVGLSVGANVIYTALHFRYRFMNKAPKYLEVGQNKSVID